VGADRLPRARVEPGAGGAPVRRPSGQRKGRRRGARVGPSRMLDYELELGAFVGRGRRSAAGWPRPRRRRTCSGSAW
jgi:hypothetical protein